MTHLLKFCFLIFILTSCKKEETPVIDNKKDKEEFVVLTYSLQDLETANQFLQVNTKGGILQTEILKEASGLAVSRSNPEIVWSHNDSGHANRLHAVGSKGENRGYFLVQGASSRDWEDICIGVGPEEGVNYIYIGDIGDNQAQYNYIVVYRFPEPDVSNLDSAGINFIDNSTVERFEFVYPDGPRDAESLMIDPWTKDLYIISKRDFRSTIYCAKYPQTPGSRTTLDKIIQLPFNWAVAGDISADGKKIAIKDKYKIYYWERNVGESLADALKRIPKLLPYILEPQGESFAWTEDGTGYFTLSEQNTIQIPELYFYKKQ
jgi:hypothetical protein